MSTSARTESPPAITLPEPRPPARLEDVAAREVMCTRTAVCRPDDTVAAAVDLLDRAGSRHVVVVDAHDVIVGVVDDRRLARAITPMSMADLTQHVDRVMDRAICRARPDEPLHRIARRLEFSPADAVLITDETGRLLGVITPTDVVREAAHRGVGVAPGVDPPPPGAVAPGPKALARPAKGT